MSAVATAVVGSAVVGGYVANKAANKASAAQNRATRAAEHISEEQLAFQKQQYQDWKDVYGDVQDNLAEFYRNYDAKHITSLGLQNIEKEYQIAKDSLVKELAQRGLDTSGLTAESLTQLNAAKAAEKATTRSNAPIQAAQAKQSFLGMGLGLESSLQQGIAGAYQNQTSVQQQAAQSYGQQAAAASQGIGQAISGIGSGIATYGMINAMNTPTASTMPEVIPAPTYIPSSSQVIV